jgi:hypothetical protein
MASYSPWTSKLSRIVDEARDLKSSIGKQSEKVGEFIRTSADNAENTWKETSTVKKACLIGAGAALLAPLAIIPVLGVVGFTSAGVAAGSLAASMQTATTVSGSVFALCQSAGAVGAVAASTSVGVGLAAGTTAGVVTAAVCKATDRGPSNDQGDEAEDDDQGPGDKEGKKLPDLVTDSGSAI